MLKNLNLRKTLSLFNLYFVTILFDKFLIIELKQNKENFYVKIPFFCSVKKKNQQLIFNFIDGSKKEFFLYKGFITFLDSFFNNLKITTKKTLILNGLGLRFFVENNLLKLKLGYSHEVFFYYAHIFLSIRIKKYGLKGFVISFFGYNRVMLGNLVEKIYKLKKADCYKARGFFFKDKGIILKNIKKN